MKKPRKMPWRGNTGKLAWAPDSGKVRCKVASSSENLLSALCCSRHTLAPFLGRRQSHQWWPNTEPVEVLQAKEPQLVISSAPHPIVYGLQIQFHWAADDQCDLVDSWFSGFHVPHVERTEQGTEKSQDSTRLLAWQPHWASSDLALLCGLRSLLPPKDPHKGSQWP